MVEQISELERTARRFRRELLDRERAASRELVDAYGEVWRRLKVRLDGLTRQIAEARARGEVPDVFQPRMPGGPAVARTPGTFSPSWLYQQGRMESLLAEVEREMAEFSRFAGLRIAGGEADAVEIAAEHARGLSLVSLGEPAPSVMASWVRLPREATSEMVGSLRDGSPLRSLLDELGPQASGAVRSSLIAGVATGQGPREIARLVRRDMGMSLVRALRISRNEIMRSYRSAAIVNYQANTHVVKGWQWSSALDRRTCLICWAKHGSFHPASEPFVTHIQCRCSPVPVTKNWKELGISDVQETQVRMAKGPDLFAKLSEEWQLDILGPSRLSRYQKGDSQLSDMVARVYSRRWGTSLRIRSLAELDGVA